MENGNKQLTNEELSVAQSMISSRANSINKMRGTPYKEAHAIASVEVADVVGITRDELMAQLARRMVAIGKGRHGQSAVDRIRTLVATRGVLPNDAALAAELGIAEGTCRIVRSRLRKEGYEFQLQYPDGSWLARQHNGHGEQNGHSEPTGWQQVMKAYARSDASPGMVASIHKASGTSSGMWLSRAALAAIGRPTHVTLYYAPATFAIGIKPAPSNDANAYKVSYRSNGGQFSIAALSKQAGMRGERTVRYLPVAVQDGMLVVKLPVDLF